MALGNNFSMGQARGKAKPILVKRRKEVVRAKDYKSFSGSAVQGSAACSYSGALNITYYHNGDYIPPQVGDVIYTTKRARKPNKFTAGHIKFHDGRRYVNLTVNEIGVVTAKSNC